MLETFLERFPATLELAIAALIFAIVVGIPLGYLAAKRAGGWLDTLRSAPRWPVWSSRCSCWRTC